MKSTQQSLILLLFSTIFLTTINGQEDKPIRVETDLVTVNVAVRDAKGNFVGSLQPANFEILDNGIKQQITDFSPQGSPVSFGIVYDMHPTTDERTKTVLEALRRFTEELRQEDDFFFLVFNEHGILSLDFIPPVEQLTKHLAPDSSRRTAPNSLYDVVYLAAEKIHSRKNEKKAILIISDGADHHSRHSYQELRNQLKNFDVQIYAVMFDEGANGRWIYSDMTGKAKSPIKPVGDADELDRAAIYEMTLKSGGTSYTSALDSQQRLYDIAGEISSEMRRQYTLGFYPTAKDGKWHQLTVRLRPENKNNKGAVLTYRQGYQSPLPSQQK